MATGGEVDSHTTCSVCLEPFAGRTPKLLPCFHTFCLSCLSQLVEREMRLTVKQASGEGDGTNDEKPARLTCPTCRTVIPVPSGGVANFQSNFYLNKAAQNKASKPCNLCDGVKDAQFYCDNCQIDFCSTCRRYHDKLCRITRAKELQGPQNTDAQSSSGDQDRGLIQEQLKMLDASLEKLTEQEKKLQEERRAIEQNIHSRHASFLRHLNEARDASLASLEEVSEAITGRLKSSLAEGRQTQGTLQQQLSSPQTPSVALTQRNVLSFAEGVKQTQLSSDNASVLHYQAKDYPSGLLDSVKSYMGKVVESSQAENRPTIERNPKAAASTAQAATPVSDDSADAVMVLRNQMAEMTRKLSSLETEHQSTGKRVSSLQSSYQQEVTSLKDKFAILQQEHSVLTAENDKLRREQADMMGARGNAGVDTEQRDASAAQSQIASLQHSVTLLQGSVTDNKYKTSTLETKFNKLTSPVAFHAELDRVVTTKTSRTLYFREIISNVGNAYNGHTGIFTAPVSGLYCFLASAATSGEGKKAIANIVLDGRRIAFLTCDDNASCSCHCIVKLSLWQRVYVETYDECSKFQGGGDTTFSGMLLQPDL
ncbi:early endosome antigen 1-like [Littorina saxatilis]|uniref:Uncharacterized protein n=1 Tax=Littorina saxatilis TaxID=31220 RepID=A0AAN9BI83_9CAEN